MKISAVIFDMDGTLTDSAKTFVDASAHGMSLFDITMDQTHFAAWMGDQRPWKELFTMHGKHDFGPEDERRMEESVIKHAHLALGENTDWIPGALETIDALQKRGIPMAIVTNSIDELIDTMDKTSGIKSLFDVIITSTTTKERAKPDPYGPLLAAERLGVNPHDCLFVGDQKFDIVAANGAGMHDCLFMGPHTPAEVGLMAKHVVRRLLDILELID